MPGYGGNGWKDLRLPLRELIDLGLPLTCLPDLGEDLYYLKMHRRFFFPAYRMQYIGEVVGPGRLAVASGKSIGAASRSDRVGALV